MKRFLKTVMNSLNGLLHHHLLLPFAISVLILSIYIIICKAKKKSIITDKMISLFVFSFYSFLVFDITLFSRIGTYQKPLSNVFGGWWIWDTDLKLYFDFSPIGNIILMMPLCFVISYLLQTFRKYRVRKKDVFIISIAGSFMVSLFIELIQILFCIGTFQLSDLFYNTLGGLLGGIAYYMLSRWLPKIHGKKKRK